MRTRIGSRHVGEKGSVRKIKKLIGVIRYAIIDAQVIKNGKVDEKLP